jgi:hypothetical protein
VATAEVRREAKRARVGGEEVEDLAEEGDDEME